MARWSAVFFTAQVGIGLLANNRRPAQIRQKPPPAVLRHRSLSQMRRKSQQDSTQ